MVLHLQVSLSKRIFRSTGVEIQVVLHHILDYSEFDEGSTGVEIQVVLHQRTCLRGYCY